MESINLSLDPQTLQWARQLAEVRGCTIDELFASFVLQHKHTGEPSDGLIGSLSDEPELVDAILDDVYKTRESQQLRTAD
jgi:hypothetical protein